MAKNEIALVQNYALAEITEETMAAISEELDGLGQIPFDTIKIPSGGTTAFEVPGDDPENPDIAKEIVGVIVHHHAMNSWWSDAFGGGNQPPECSSIDGKTGIDAASGECVDCATCRRNQFGSDANGKGKACKNMHRLYILRDGEVLPVIFTCPPSSLKTFKEYLAKRIVMKGKRAHQVVTKITLKKAQNADGIGYSQAIFQLAGALSPEQIKAIEPTVDLVKSIATQIPAADAVSEAAPQAEFTEVHEAEKLPF